MSDRTDALMVEGYAGQMHAMHHLEAGRLYIAWPRLDEAVREKWRAKARENIALMEAKQW